MIEFTVNNKPYQVEDRDNTALLWFLRDELQMTGTKFGCGKGLCGACTVHLNGEAVRSCRLPINTLQKARITTIEGITPKDGLHPVQEAWIKHSVPQCGYCQSGQIMSAASLVAKHPKPSEEKIHESMAGNICRCGTYKRIKKALLTINR